MIKKKKKIPQTFLETGCPSLYPTSHTWTQDKDVMAFRKQHICQHAAPSWTKGWIHGCNISHGNVPPLPLPGFLLNLLKQKMNCHWILQPLRFLSRSIHLGCVLRIAEYFEVEGTGSWVQLLSGIEHTLAPNLHETAHELQEFAVRFWVFWVLFLIKRSCYQRGDGRQSLQQAKVSMLWITVRSDFAPTQQHHFKISLALEEQDILLTGTWCSLMVFALPDMTLKSSRAVPLYSTSSYTAKLLSSYSAWST